MFAIRSLAHREARRRGRGLGMDRGYVPEDTGKT